LITEATIPRSDVTTSSTVRMTEHRCASNQVNKEPITRVKKTSTVVRGCTCMLLKEGSLLALAVGFHCSETGAVILMRSLRNAVYSNELGAIANGYCASAHVWSSPGQFGGQEDNPSAGDILHMHDGGKYASPCVCSVHSSSQFRVDDVQFQLSSPVLARVGCLYGEPGHSCGFGTLVV
jgi:hypothetical protein